MPLLRSKDGGKSIHSVEGPHHGDYLDLWIDPVDSRRMIVGHDGGADLTVDGGRSWYRPALATGQFYNLDVDDRIPYWIGGTMQDEGTALGPSNSLRGEGITLGDWITAGGGEAGDFAFDRATPGVVYAGEYGGIFTRFDQTSGNAPNVSYYPTNHAASKIDFTRITAKQGESAVHGEFTIYPDDTFSFTASSDRIVSVTSYSGPSRGKSSQVSHPRARARSTTRQ